MRVIIIGSGNVAEALALAIERSSMELVQLYGRNRESVEQIYRLLGRDVSESVSMQLADADLYIIAVSDAAVSEVSSMFDFPSGSIVAHTAASIDIDSICTQKGINKAVFYPLQTFTKGCEVDFQSVPIFIEALDEQSYLKIESVALELSERVIPLSSSRRKELHVAAVFSCNFTMAMLTATHDILRRCELPLDLYEPLMQQTLEKAFGLKADPREGLTGPAVRGDEATMEQHLARLNDEPKLAESDLLIDMYKIISKYIWETSKRI